MARKKLKVGLKNATAMIRRSARLARSSSHRAYLNSKTVDVKRGAKSSRASTSKTVKLKREVNAPPTKPPPFAKKGTTAAASGVYYDAGAVEDVLKEASKLRLGSSRWFVEEGLRHLLAVNPDVWGPALAKYGLPKRIREMSERSQNDRATNPFSSLFMTIVYQQLAGAACAAVMKKVCTGLDVKECTCVTPAHVMNANFEEVQDASTGKWRVEINGIHSGLSRNKAKYIQSLADHFSDASKLSGLPFDQLSDEELRKRLCAVKGLGPWSVEMFLIFKLARPDVFSPGDLAVRKGFAALCGLDPTRFQKANRETFERAGEMAKPFSPYRTLCTIYSYACYGIEEL